ncbi:hypothetical protein ACI0FR_02385 [Paenochrobactrum sp. BZR 201-1]
MNRRSFIAAGLASTASILTTAGVSFAGDLSQERVTMDEKLSPVVSPLPFAMTTPVRVARVGLKSRDAESLAQYYRNIIGLQEIARRNHTIILGAGDRELLEIEQFSSAKPDDPRSAGLYHTAFLLPSRVDLARWARFAIDKQIPVAGASDHNVSEAVYLTDPEGNGIEIYADRPHEGWQWNGSQVVMGTEALDVGNLLDAGKHAGGEWLEAPQNTVVGHVHLRVGNAQHAETFWHDELGFDTVQAYGDKAVFLSTGGYHHHIAANSWQSNRAEKRDLDRAGLSFVVLEDSRGGASNTFEDPWGNVITTSKV